MDEDVEEIENDDDDDDDVNDDGSDEMARNRKPATLIVNNNSIFQKLKRKAMTGATTTSFQKLFNREKFQGYQLRGELDTYSPNDVNVLDLPFQRRRSKIIEIVTTKEIILALAQNGVCAVFSRETLERICLLNIEREEVIRSLFYNKSNESIITVSVYRPDGFSTLHCRSTLVEKIVRGQPNDSMRIFEDEQLKYPGFVEFDDQNGKILTFATASATMRTFKVWDLVNYRLLYVIPDDIGSIHEVKISPGILLLINKRMGGHLPLSVLNIETGEMVSQFNLTISRSKKILFIELCQDKIIVKQEEENLHIVDMIRDGRSNDLSGSPQHGVRILRSAGHVEIPETRCIPASSFIFLNASRCFLIFRNHSVEVWNFNGEHLRTFDDRLMWFRDTNNNNISVTNDQDKLISFRNNDSMVNILSREEDSLDFNPANSNPGGALFVNDILTGKSLVRIETKGDPVRAQALRDVTHIYYNEFFNELFTGTPEGVVHLWTV